jgi:amino acid adenylation domain-containing protein
MPTTIGRSFSMSFAARNSLADLLCPQLQSSHGRQAVDDGELSFTFGELEALASKFASELVRQGVRRGDRVVVLAPQGAGIVPTALGIWKAGGVYAPVDVTLPAGRFQAIAANIQPKVIALAANFEFPWSVPLGIPVVRLNDQVNCEPVDTPGPSGAGSLPLLNGDDLAVIIHTSGSTGLPKGVTLSHGSVLAYFDGHSRIYEFTDRSRCLSLTSFHFDVSFQDLFMPLSCGSFVHVNTDMLIPWLILPKIREAALTHVICASSILALFTGDYNNLAKYDLSSLGTIGFGGELTDPKLVGAWLEAVPGLRMVNCYGPTEANSASLSYVIDASNRNTSGYYPIGKPHKGVLAVLLGEDNRTIVCHDEVGELVIGGPGLMRGYWNNPAATEATFLHLNGERFYRTGDLCSRDPEGNFVFQGRKDSEIKIAGRRVNLLEISERLNTIEMITNSHVTSIDVSGVKTLVALCEMKGALDARWLSGIQEVINKYFPSYMRPRHYGFYHERLHTSTGKTDVRRLTSLLHEAVTRNVDNFYEYVTAAKRFVPVYPSSEDGSSSR